MCTHHPSRSPRHCVKKSSVASSAPPFPEWVFVLLSTPLWCRSHIHAASFDPLFFILPSTDLVHYRHSTGEYSIRLSMFSVPETRGCDRRVCRPQKFPRIPSVQIFSQLHRSWTVFTLRSKVFSKPFPIFVFPAPAFTPKISAMDVRQVFQLHLT